MNDNNTIPPAPTTEFTDGWRDFERRLSVLLADLALPTLNDTVSLRFPKPDDGLGEIALEGSVDDNATAFVPGVRVTLPGHDARFYRLRDNETNANEKAEVIPDAARAVCAYLRDSALVAHPSLLSVQAERTRDVGERLGVPDAGEVVREVQALVLDLRGDARPGPDRPEALFPESPEQLRAAIETALRAKYGSLDLDDDGDYRIDHPAIHGSCYYVTLMVDRPLVRIWKTIVSGVSSRPAATIEANFLNRAHPLTKWVLWGHDLVQEVYVSGAPFAPHMFEEMLDRFDEQYGGNVSALRLRLGEGAR